MRESEDENFDEILADTAAAVDFSLALVVASSPVTRVVLSRIAERTGLRTHARAPEEAQPVIGDRLPAIAILAGGADGHECDRLLARLAALRRPAGHSRAPLIVLLANSNTPRLRADLADSVVTKPVTPDRLQPVIRDLMDRLRT